MLADAMPPEQEIEEDDQTPTDDDLRRRRPIPVNVPPLGSADDLQTQPVLRASPSASRAIPVGAEEADASEPQETAPIIRPAGSRAIPTSTTPGVAPVAPTRAIPVDTPQEVVTPVPRMIARPIPQQSMGDESAPAVPMQSRPIPVLPSSSPTMPRVLPKEESPFPAYASENQRSGPIQTGVASLWTKAQNIHNPILRVLGEIGAGGARALDTAGQAVGRVIPAVGAVESAIPGTTMNAEAKERQAEKQDEQQAELAQKEAVTGETKARTNAIENPQPKEETEGKTITTDEGILQWDPATRRYDVPVGAAPGRSETEGKTITTDQGVMQWNPDTKRYDIPVGGAPIKQNTKDEDITDYLDANALPNTPANREKARTAIAKRGRPEEGAYFPVPDAKGNIMGWVNPKSRDYRPISSIPGLSGSGENGTIPTKGGAREKDAAEAERLAGVIMNKANGDPDAALKLFDQHSSDVTDADQKRLGPAIRRAIRARRQINKPQSALDKIISGDIDGGLNDLQPAPASK
ncbi:MAG: hypothetical protein WAL52_13785 [Candidatus Sulfotelmatobacter sp.]